MKKEEGSEFLGAEIVRWRRKKEVGFWKQELESLRLKFLVDTQKSSF